REGGLRLSSLDEQAVQGAARRASLEGAQLPRQAPQPLFAGAVRHPVCGAGGGLPADLERRRRVLGKKTELADPGEEGAVDFSLAVRRQAPPHLPRAGPALSGTE